MNHRGLSPAGSAASIQAEEAGHWEVVVRERTTDPLRGRTAREVAASPGVDSEPVSLRGLLHNRQRPSDVPGTPA